jgi:hypothetical protein
MPAVHMLYSRVFPFSLYLHLQFQQTLQLEAHDLWELSHSAKVPLGFSKMTTTSSVRSSTTLQHLNGHLFQTNQLRQTHCIRTRQKCNKAGRHVYHQPFVRLQVGHELGNFLCNAGSYISSRTLFIQYIDQKSLCDSNTYDRPWSALPCVGCQY